jgi:hypothetical protein
MLALTQPPAPAPSLLEVIARAPGAAALIVEALRPADRKALRLEHSSLRDAVDEATKKLTVTLQIEAATAADAADAADARPPTALRWPRLESLTLAGRLWMASDLDALGPAPWEGMKELRIHEETEVEVSDNEGVAALAGTPSFALRYLKMNYWTIGADGLQTLAAARWPLRELVLADCDDVGIGHAFEVLARLPGLRELRLEHCFFTDAAYESLLSANLPALSCLCINFRCMVDFPDISPAGLFAGFPNLKELGLGDWDMGKEGARLLASRTWRRLRELHIEVDDEGLAELARGACRWPALTRLALGGPKVTLKEVRRWAPRVTVLQFL